MRLWTVHPKYLDRQGLLAAWREALLAQKVLLGATKGYRNHPQLDRFKKCGNPLAAIGFYLSELQREAARRNYRFDAAKILLRETGERIRETRGQLEFEWEHLKAKIRKRQGRLKPGCAKIQLPDAHPLFRIVPGKARSWERGKQPL